MKKILLLVTLLSIMIGASAQTEKGNFMVSGSTSLMIDNSKTKLKLEGVTDRESKINSFSFLPSVGYFVADNLAVTANLGYLFKKDKKSDDSERQFLLGVGGMYYFLQDNVRPFISAGVGYVNHKSDDGKDDETFNGLNLNVGGGVAFFIRDNIAINLGIGYNKNNLKHSDNDKIKIEQDQLSAVVGFSLFF